MRNKLTLGLITATVLILSSVLLQECKKENPTASHPLTSINNTLGFGLLNKIKGIWDGPVSSTTALGNYPSWVVDFRPITENQISEKSELDTVNNIHMTFFIARYNNEYRLCFRNGGSWSGKTRVSYFLADSVSETASHSYYRFTEILKGKNRAYSEIIFRSDSLLMNSYTNKSNTLSTATLHMSWRAKRQDTTSCAAAVTYFSFPKKTLRKDFSTTFKGQTEAVYYSIGTGDPYAESLQPYLGRATINYTYASGYTPNADKKTFLIITTQPLISGAAINTANLKYRSRYVMLPATDQTYVFNTMHPGTYYLYAFYDADGNNTFSSGDWVSTANTSFILASQGTTTATTQINFTIP